MEFQKLSSGFLKMGSAADREAFVELKDLTFEWYKAATAQVDKEQKATTMKSYFMAVRAQVNKEEKAATVRSFFMLVVSLFLFTFAGFMVARRNNRRLLNTGNTQGEEPDEERQMLVGNSAEANAGTEARSRHCLSTIRTKLNLGTRLALVNFILEIPSAVFDQIASDGKPTYVLIVMLIAFASMLVCLVELVNNGRKQRIRWKWTSRRMPWLYHPPPNNKPFGTLMEMVGLVCVMAQFIISTINYSFCLQDHAAPIKMSVWPTIFSFGLLCCRLTAKPKEDHGEISRTSDQDGGDVALNQATLEPLTPAELQL